MLLASAGSGSRARAGAEQPFQPASCSRTGGHNEGPPPARRRPQVQQWLAATVGLGAEARALLVGITGPEAVALDAEVLDAVEMAEDEIALLLEHVSVLRTGLGFPQDAAAGALTDDEGSDEGGGWASWAKKGAWGRQAQRSLQRKKSLRHRRGSDGSEPDDGSEPGAAESSAGFAALGGGDGRYGIGREDRRLSLDEDAAMQQWKSAASPAAKARERSGGSAHEPPRDPLQDSALESLMGGSGKHR